MLQLLFYDFNFLYHWYSSSIFIIFNFNKFYYIYNRDKYDTNKYAYEMNDNLMRRLRAIFHTSGTICSESADYWHSKVLWEVGNAFEITVKAQNPELLVGLLNFLYRELMLVVHYFFNLPIKQLI